ncbi:MAG TPA: hypothetical protein PLV92_30240, partial [Pirellulaceae bacterium]|nr:hypothetical protein [Pirellulaceae bacterium]
MKRFSALAVLLALVVGMIYSLAPTGQAASTAKKKAGCCCAVCECPNCTGDACDCAKCGCEQLSATKTPLVAAAGCCSRKSVKAAVKSQACGCDLCVCPDCDGESCT